MNEAWWCCGKKQWDWSCTRCGYKNKDYDTGSFFGKITYIRA